MRYGVVLLAAVAGCGKSGESGVSPSRTSDCNASAELVGFLARMDHDPGILPDDDAQHLVTRTDLPPRRLPPAPYVHVTVTDTGTEIDVQGRLVDLAELQPALAETFARTQHDPPDVPRGRIYLVIDDAVAWDQVVAVAQAAFGAGFARVSWLFARPAVVMTPPPDDGTPREFPPCPALQELWRHLGEGSGDKGDELIAGIGPAIAACDCKVDVPALRSAMVQLFAQAHPTTALDVTLVSDATPIELPAGMPWRDASKQLVPGRTWLAVAP